MASYPSGKGEVCKTFMRRFKSARRLHVQLDQACKAEPPRCGGPPDAFMSVTDQTCKAESPRCGGPPDALIALLKQVLQRVGPVSFFGGQENLQLLLVKAAHSPLVAANDRRPVEAWLSQQGFQRVKFAIRPAAVAVLLAGGVDQSRNANLAQDGFQLAARRRLVHKVAELIIDIAVFKEALRLARFRALLGAE